ncbi:MAG TPA: FdhF/YdeP family oxidoreductase [Planctomycetaceae bacterium]|nr:FdhF/YdeP family oxidoreductase [Planctomycetaceae bacterium]
MKRMKSGGGWKAILYTMRMANRVGWLPLWRAMRSKNACKTCALGMGGQMGGMVNEGGHFPEVCKKSLQAMASDMQDCISPEFFARYSIEQLRALSPRELEFCGRVVDPVYAGPGESHYRVISWDEALARVSDKLKSSGPERSFFYASGRSSNEAGFLLQLLARRFGTNYVNNCSYYCHQASGVGLSSSLGTSTATVQLDDVEHADLYILIGGNPASNHPRLLRSLMQVRRRGGNVIVVNPVKEVGLVNFRVPSDPWSLLFGTKIASLYVQPHIGGDVALLTGVAKMVLERGREDVRFIDERTEGFDDFKRLVESTSWHEIECSSGLGREAITQFANTYLSAKNVVIGWTMGITHHLHGVQNVQMIANLALLRGMVGRPGAGLMPIRGHSNVQGVGSVGVTPQLKQAILERFEQRLGIDLPRSPGLDTMACMTAAERGEMESAVCLGGNLFGSNPDSHFAARAISRLDQIAYLTTTLNTGHAWGRAKETLILPVLPRDEEPQPTTQESMFSFVRLSDGGKPRFPGPRSEISVITGLGRRVLGEDGPVNWRDLESHERVRQLIAELIPGFEPLSEIDRTRREFHIAGRRLDGPKFPTESGRARFHAVSLPEAPDETGRRLRLMTVRSEGQFNTVVYEEEDIYRGQERRDVILMSRDDVQRLGLKPNQLVTVKSSVGQLRRQIVRPYDIRPGNALMYYPEANVLVPADVDPLSKTPAFKSVSIEILAESEADIPARPYAATHAMKYDK